MARPRNPKRDEAFQLWKKSNGKKKLKDIAVELEVSDSQIRKWKNQDKWDDQLNGNVTKSKGNVTKNKSSPKNEKKRIVVEESLPSDELTDKQRLFCLYYLKYFNATKAYQKAYESSYSVANVEGYRNLVKPSIKNEIDRIKNERMNGISLDGQFVLQKYIDIAFADITDFAVFGKKEIEVIGPFGPMKDEDGNQLMQEVNYVDFKESTEIDGTIVTEVKQGRDGLSVKLADKMKALEFLAKYTDLLSEFDRKRLQDEKLKAETEFTQLRSKQLKGTQKDTSMLDALVEGRKHYEQMMKEREKNE